MKFVYLLGLLFFSTHMAFAKEFPVQARLFLSNTAVDPKDFNQEMVALGLEEMDKTNNLGIEATYKVFKYFDGGIRYTRRTNKMEEEPDLATDYFAEMTQDSVMLLGRVPFLRTEFLRMDAFAGVGGSNTSIELSTATQTGELTKKESGDWFASPYAAAGASVSLGYKWIYLVVEAGFEANKVEKFKKVGTVNDNIQELDLSGSYFMLGLMFDGVKATQ